jgi:ABC-type uncharacterized transport system permease subunit
VVPIGVAVTVPSESLTGRLDSGRIVTVLASLVITVVVTRLVWRAGTRHYSGASA